jgi:hypothetical protein
LKEIDILERCSRCKLRRGVQVTPEGKASAFIPMKVCDDHDRCAGELHKLAQAEGKRSVDRMRAAEAKRQRKRDKRMTVTA